MDYPLTTTLNRVYARHPCDSGWNRGLAAANKTEADDEPLTYTEIFDVLGFYYALWCCRAEPQYDGIWRRYAVWCCRRVQYAVTDDRLINALDVAERHANELATDEELVAARHHTFFDRGHSYYEKLGKRGRDGINAWAADTAAFHSTTECMSVNLIRVLDKAFMAGSNQGPNIWGPRISASSDAFRQLVTTGKLP
jgi:hypothetical protein